MGSATDKQPEDERGDQAADGVEGDRAPAQGDDAIDASLHLALSDLERMLDGRKATSDTAGRGAAGPAQDAGLDDDGEQYTIPLLDEVVIPGPSHVVPPPAAAADTPAPLPLDDDEPSVRARIAARVASEMDVIIQDRIEQAVEQAREEIRQRVRNHMDIILPEIVEELIQARRRHGGP